MTKKIVLIGFFIVLSSNVFPKNHQPAPFNTLQIHESFNMFDFKNGNDLGPFKNDYLTISPFAIDSTGAFLINLWLGLGIGSYAQGDVLGGTIGLVGEIGGLALFFGGAIIHSTANNGTSTPSYDVLTAAMIIGGAALFLGARIFECIRPWFFE